LGGRRIDHHATDWIARLATGDVLGRSSAVTRVMMLAIMAVLFHHTHGRTSVLAGGAMAMAGGARWLYAMMRRSRKRIQASAEVPLRASASSRITPRRHPEQTRCAGTHGFRLRASSMPNYGAMLANEGH
jgi:hypothetical protein